MFPAAAMAQSEEQAASSEPAATTSTSNDADIVVTATRREESILDVPISIAAYSQDRLDERGIRNIEDLARTTPGLTLTQGFSGIKYLGIRGLISSVGATMTGVYIDDTPIQVRSLVLMSNFYPALYDLDRVEVLRGPQGTLFGAGAMGGVVRFILAKPNLTEFTGNMRGELAFTEGGDPTYEFGGALAGPIIKDKLGFRVSAYYRRDGGYIDRVPWRATRGTAEENSNSNRALVANAALTFQPTQNLSITPSIFYQKANRDDASTYWRFGNGSTRPQPPVFQSGEGVASKGEDTAILYQNKVEWDVGPVSLVSNSAITDRKVHSLDDGTAFLLDIFDAAFGNAFDGLLPIFGGTGPLDFNLGMPGGVPGAPNCGECVLIDVGMRQKSFSQEFRVQSNNPNARLKYVFGAYYQNSRQSSEELDYAPFAGAYYLLPFVFPLPPSRSLGHVSDWIRDVQYAAFGQIDWEVIENLTLTAGLRYSRVEFDFEHIDFDQFTDVPGVPQTGRQTENPLTPKFGIEYQANPNLMFYASAAKGFRAGGVNTANDDPTCAADLAELGLTAIPRTYESDGVWSYELGAKGRVGGIATFSADVFTINWDNIQRSRTLPSCVAIFTDNYGKARSRGLEAQVTLTPAEGLSLDIGVGYVDATQRQTIEAVGGSGGIVVRKGDRFANPWTISLGGDYETPIGWNDAKVYGHVDYTYKSGRVGKPGVIGFNPVIARIDEQDFASARVGIRTGNYDLSAFVNNLTNSRNIIGQLHFQPSERIQVQTFRPRTFGVTGRYNF